MNTELINICDEYVRSFLDLHSDERFTYHNLNHTLEIRNSVEALAKKAKLSDPEVEDLIIAALFHDVGYYANPEDHENESVKICASFLNEIGISEKRINNINELILATKMGWVGTNKNAFLLRDADLNSLSTKHFLEYAENLRLEKNRLFDSNISEEQWINENIEFFSKHKYLSDAGKKMYKKSKNENLKKLIKMSEKKQPKPEKVLTLASNKSAQTQLKTALRNHLDLSSLADNKANLMLSVNAIVITVGLPLLINRITEIPNILFPAIILAATSITSMIFATFSTRPIKMGGITEPGSIEAGKSNLFFFGNFYKMSFEEYEEGINKIIADEELLNSSIARDLFFLGKSLGKKYEYLRWCYTIFIVGVVGAVIAYIAMLIFN